MSAVAMSGSDTFKMNSRIFADFADADWGHLTFPNDIAAVKTGKNGNSTYSLNETGKQAEFVLRLIRLLLQIVGCWLLTGEGTLKGSSRAQLRNQ